MVLRWSLAFSPPEEDFRGFVGVRVKWSRDLAENGKVVLELLQPTAS